MKVLLIFVLACVASATAVFFHCPKGWTYGTEDKCFKLFPNLMIKEDAQAACTQIPNVVGGKLLDINDINTFQFIQNYYGRQLIRTPPGQPPLDVIPPTKAIWNSLSFDFNQEVWTGTSAATPIKRFNNFEVQPMGAPPMLEPQYEMLSCTVYPAVEFQQAQVHPELVPLPSTTLALQFMTLANCERELPYICEAPALRPPTTTPRPPPPFPTRPGVTTPIIPRGPSIPDPGVPAPPNPGAPRPGTPGRGPGTPTQGRPNRPTRPNRPNPGFPNRPNRPTQPNRPNPGFPNRPNPGRPNRPNQPSWPNPGSPPNRPNPGRPNRPNQPSRPNPGFTPSQPNPGFPSRPNPGTPQRPRGPWRYQAHELLYRPYEYRYNNYIFDHRFGGLGIRP